MNSWSRLFFAISLTALAPQAALANTSSLGIDHPLGGTRYMFVSPVDQKVWGIVCPGSLESYLGQSRDQVLRCGYSESYGPVTMRDFLQNVPADIDPYQLEQGLRSQAIVPVSTSRDQYYQVWDVLVRLAAIGHPPVHPCQPICQTGSIAFDLEVMGPEASFYIYATEGQGHLGSFNVGPNDGSKFYLNVLQKAVINMHCANATIYLSRALKDAVIVNTNGGYVRYYYF